MTPTQQTALDLRAAGVACIPVGADKRPLVSSWKKFMTELPTEAQLEKWFAADAGIALVAGEVQCIDVDEKYEAGLMVEFERSVRNLGLGGVWDRCLIQSTPSGGYHVVFRSEGEPIRNLKLASKENREVLIETRGAGGYFLIEPSAGYVVQQGDFEMLPVLTEEERADLMDVARSFNRKAPRDESRSATTAGELSPGDDYDQRGDFRALMESHGWVWTDDKHLRRPGKDRGISGSFGVIPNRFWVFSTSTEFENEKLYKPYMVYAMLEHGGDVKRAIGELARQGYGAKRERKEVVGSAEALPDAKASLEKALEDAKSEERSEEDDLLERALRERFKYSENLQCGRELLRIGDTTVATAGNLVAISAQAKAGKTAVYSGGIASALRKGTYLHCSSPEQGGAVIHIDTEQSAYDAHRLGRTVLHRAGIRGDEPRYMAFRWRDFPVSIRKRALYAACAEGVLTHGYIHSIWIDGVADLVNSVNDEQECNELVTELMALSTECDCMICCVIHLNPTSDAKSRGHLGSALERKAEANIRLNKNEDMVTEVWGEKMRGKPILKKDALCFAWDEQAGRHEAVEAGSKSTKQAKGPGKEEREAMATLDVQEWIASRCYKVAEINRLIQTRYNLGKNSWGGIINQATQLVDGTARERFYLGQSRMELIGPAESVAREKLKMEKEYEQNKQTEIK